MKKALLLLSAAFALATLNAAAHSPDGSAPKSAAIDANCATDFFTIKNNGDIQQWSLINNSISGGQTVLNGDGTSVAYCGPDDAPTFYLGRFPDTGILFHDPVEGWQEIPTDKPLLNNGGHGADQYYLAHGGGQSRMLYYFDGSDLTLIDSLSSGFFSVYDIAVDIRGKAWVFRGASTNTVNGLHVYDTTGVQSSYSISFSSTGAYGTFFLNDTLYVGFGNSNSIRPVLLSGNEAQLGDPIPFQHVAYLDMASCQSISSLSTAAQGPEALVHIFPNPSHGRFHLEAPQRIEHAEIFDLSGQRIASLQQPLHIDLSAHPDGMYLVKITTQKGIQHHKIIKRH